MPPSGTRMSLTLGTCSAAPYVPELAHAKERRRAKARCVFISIATELSLIVPLTSILRQLGYQRCCRIDCNGKCQTVASQRQSRIKNVQGVAVENRRCISSDAVLWAIFREAEDE